MVVVLLKDFLLWLLSGSADQAAPSETEWFVEEFSVTKTGFPSNAFNSES